MLSASALGPTPQSRRAGLILVALLAVTTRAAAQTPEVTIRRADDPPTIDGALDDAAWADATVIDDFRQVEPVEGGAPSERTEVLLLYDENALYVAFRCHDRAPDLIVATTMNRDAELDADDRVSFSIDPHLDRRNGFLFEMNPTGAKVDGLIEDNDRLRTDWDGIWYGRATIDEGGWTAEMAIPHKTVSFARSTTRWGFNASRVIRRRTETVRWAAALQNQSLLSMADAGILEGIENINQGTGLDIIPFGLSRFTHAEDGDSFEVDGGLDLFYKLTPSTTIALTVNTDFAETEVDERRVNLTRFPLFFPEKRDFFLQDAGIFNFGGINRNPLPFFSRRIGIGPGGAEQDILAGVKVTGREGAVNFGALSVQMKDDPDLGAKNLSVGRVSLNVLEESTVGLIGTLGDPGIRGDNVVAGADFNYRTSRFAGDQVLESHAWFLLSDTSNDERDNRGGAAGFKLGYPNDRINWEIGFSQIDEDFDPALGFVPRGAIREYFATWRYRWRPRTWIRRLDFDLGAFVTTDLEDEVETSSYSITPFAIETESDQFLAFEYSFEREQLVEDFEISDGVVLPPGDYRFNRYTVDLETSRGRPLSLGAEISAGDFFNGTRFETGIGVEWRISPGLFLSAEYEYNDIELDQGDFITRLARARINVFFSPDLTWSNVLQYDNVSDSIGLNSRLRWIIEPGNELFFVVNQGWDYDSGDLSPSFTAITTKLNWTFRF